MNIDTLERLNLRLDELPAEFDLHHGTNGHRRVLRFLVTGGCGYLGFEIGRALHELGAQVTLLDLHLPEKIEKQLDEKLVFVKGNVCSYESLDDVCQGMDCVFHVASFGMCSVDQLNEHLTHDVNVNGTKNVIRACQNNGVSKLIYTSSYNVVFGSKTIENGDDFVPYASQDEFVEYYSKTKQIADKMVLGANESDTACGGKLYTCCIRPAGIYGPGERRHIARISRYIVSGLVCCQYGDGLADWSHINNLVQAHLLAIPALSKATDHIGAGQAYFISDENPLKTFEFLRPLFYGFGKTLPSVKIPSSVVYFVAFLLEFIHWILKPIIVLEPLLTRNEVLKMTVTHYQTMSRAKKELGYRPRKYEFADVVHLYISECYPNYASRYSVYGSDLKTLETPATKGIKTFANILFLILSAIVFSVLPMAPFF